MPTETRSPISRKGSKAGSDQPISPGARSNPSRAGARDSAEPEGKSETPAKSLNPEE
jgi:hypothetical protein